VTFSPVFGLKSTYLCSHDRSYTSFITLYILETPALITTQPTFCTYGSHMFLTVNRDCFLKQH